MPRGRGAGRDAEFRIEGQEFTRLLTEVKGFDRKLALQLRRNMRTAGRPIVEDVRRTVMQPPPGDVGGSVGTRAAIAKGVALRISAAKKGGGVTIAASSRFLPANRKPMLRAYNKPNWRHPVFGNSEHWVDQQGRPYFDSVILEHREQLRRAVELALTEAAAAIGR